jgi:hypothetical protein
MRRAIFEMYSAFDPRFRSFQPCNFGTLYLILSEFVIMAALLEDDCSPVITDITVVMCEGVQQATMGGE